MKLNCVPKTAMGKDLTLLSVKAVNMYFSHHRSRITNAEDIFPETCESCLEKHILRGCGRYK